MKRFGFLLARLLLAPLSIAAQGVGARSLAGCYSIRFGEGFAPVSEFVWLPGETVMRLTLDSVSNSSPQFRSYVAVHVAGRALPSAPPVPAFWTTSVDSSGKFTLSQYDPLYGVSLSFVPADSGFAVTVLVLTDELVSDSAGTLRSRNTRSVAWARRVQCPTG
jgi:hypothetical protein